MERLGTFTDASAKVLADVRRCLTTIQGLSALPFETPEAGVAILQRLRSETYEDLNQIQHEHLIVRAALWLIAGNICPLTTEWFWNPRQTGDDQEPDLQGLDQGAVIVSAEITTSAKPDGVIDTRMRNTLRKLSATPGAKYYFVRTESMRNRAFTKVDRAGWTIQVVLLPL
jgi:hypothetical protein